MSQNTIRLRQKRAGFTLIELLVVIAIIGILASLLLPALSKARRKAVNVLCVNNLKTWGTIIQFYRDDYRGFIMYDSWANVSDGGWAAIKNDKLAASPYAPYCNVVADANDQWISNGSNPQKRGTINWGMWGRMCPVFERYEFQKFGANANPKYGYLFTRGLTKNAQGGLTVWPMVGGKVYPYPESNITKPSEFMLLIDTDGSLAPSSGKFYIQAVSDANSVVLPAIYRHDGGANVLFADSHVQFANWNEISAKFQRWITFNP